MSNETGVGQDYSGYEFDYQQPTCSTALLSASPTTASASQKHTMRGSRRRHPDDTDYDEEEDDVLLRSEEPETADTFSGYEPTSPPAYARLHHLKAPRTNSWGTTTDEMEEASEEMDPLLEPHHSDIRPRHHTLSSGGVDGAEWLRLAVGCKTYLLKIEHLHARAPESFLAEFAAMTHDERLQKCHAYFEDTHEYLFERSHRLFEQIYKFYVTGHLHRPLDICLQEFIDELAFWAIPSSQLQTCCAPKIMESESENAEAQEVDKEADLFIGLRYAAQRRRLWALTEGDGSLSSKLFSVLSIGLVLVSVTALVFSSIRQFQIQMPSSEHPSGYTWEPLEFFYYLESACIAWFTLEYLLRFAIAPRKLIFLTQTLNVVDFLAVMPFYLELTLQWCGVDSDDLKDFQFALVMVRLLRSLRVMRILKVSRYSVGMRIFALTIKSSASQLAMIVMVFSIGVIFFATMVYYMEKDEPGTPFTSIPVGFWWCIVTMTTVGYGDIVPITTIGKMVGSAAIVSGVLVLALPITIMVDNFMKVAGK